MTLFPWTSFAAYPCNVAAVVPMPDRLGPKARRETGLFKHDLRAIQSKLDLVLDNPVALRNARGGASFGKTKGVNGRVQLLAIINIDVVKVSPATEFVKSCVSFVRALGPDREGVAIPRANVVDDQNVLVSSETLHLFGGRVDMVSGHLFTEGSRRVVVTLLVFASSGHMSELGRDTGLAKRVPRDVRHLMGDR